MKKERINDFQIAVDAIPRHLRKYVDNPGEKIWARRDGSFIYVKKMNNQHLLNSLRMVLRNEVYDWANIFAAEILHRGLSIPSFEEIEIRYEEAMSFQNT